MPALATFGSLVLAALAVAGYLFFHYFDLPQAAHEADEAAAAYRKAGFPWEAKDLEPSPPIKPEANAATYVLAAMTSGDQKRFERESKQLRGLADQRSYAALEQRLGTYGTFLGLAEKAGDQHQAYFAKDWDEGIYILYPELVTAKTLERLLCLSAETRAGRHDTVGCILQMRRAWSLSASTGQEPSLIGFMVGIQGRLIALDGAQRCAWALGGDEGALPELASEVDKFVDMPNFPNAIRGESYVELAMRRNMSLSKDYPGLGLKPDAKKKLLRTGLPKSMVDRAAVARHMQAWIKAQAIIARYPNDPEALGNALDKFADKIYEHASASNMTVSMTFSMFRMVGREAAEVEAQVWATRALLSALEVRARTGKLPSKIEEIPGTWIDPFTQEPLRVKQAGDSIRIYSLGPDRKDNGGIAKSELRLKNYSDLEDKKVGYDIVASFPPIRSSQ